MAPRFTGTVRPARSADVGAIKALLAETWHATYDGWMGAERVASITAEWHAPERLAAEIASASAVALVAEDGGSLLGTALALRQTPDTAVLSRLYVRPAAQGHGVGLALFEAAMAALGSVAVVKLEVEPRNAAAIRFYERRGFLPEAGRSACGGDARAGEAMTMTLRRRAAADAKAPVLELPAQAPNIRAVTGDSD